MWNSFVTSYRFILKSKTFTTINLIGLTAGLTASVGIITVASLIAFLITKELASSNGSGTFVRIAKFVNVGIIPLLITFAVIVTLDIIAILA